MSASREAREKKKHWQYVTKNLHRNTTNETQFTYNKVIYEKSEALQDIERRSGRINAVLLLLLLLMFLLAGRYHNIYLVVFYLVSVIVGEAARLFMLPKDIKAHLKDTGYRER